METDFHQTETSGGVRSVRRALALLLALSKEGKSLTFLASEVGISPSTASRLLDTLEAQAFVSHTQNNTYVPGLALTSLIYNTDQWAPLRTVARNATRALRAELDETSAFFVRSISERLCIESVESTRLVRRVCLPGERGLVHLGAAGKALLAFGPEEDPCAALFGPDDRFTTASEATRTVAALTEELTEIRARGYALSRQESTLESWAVAAPIYVDRMLAGVITMVIPFTRYDDDYVSRVTCATTKVANDYSDRYQTGA